MEDQMQDTPKAVKAVVEDGFKKNKICELFCEDTSWSRWERRVASMQRKCTPKNFTSSNQTGTKTAFLLWTVFYTNAFYTKQLLYERTLTHIKYILHTRPF